MGNECSMNSSAGRITGSSMAVAIANGAALPSSHSVLSAKEVKLLRETYEKIKTTNGLKRQLANDAMNMIVARVPEALQTFFNINTEHDDEKWSLMRQGFVFLDGIEQALRLADKPAVLKTYLARLTKFHRQRCSISTYMMVEAVDSFECIIISYLQTIYCNQKSFNANLDNNNKANGNGNIGNGAPESNGVPANGGHSELSCDVCSIWGRFLGQVRTFIAASAPESETAPDSNTKPPNDSNT